MSYVYSTQKKISYAAPIINPDKICGKFLRYPYSASRMAEGGMRINGIYKSSSINKPLVSIITVVFNRVDKLERALKAVLNQTYDNIEYIVIDGGSTDGTLDIIKRYENAIDYYVSEPDSGIYNAMNKGLELATGEFIGILNSDDWFGPEAVELSINKLQETNSDYSSAISTYMNADGVAGFVFTPRYFSNVALFSLQPCGHGTMFISAKCINAVGNYDENYQIVSDFKLQMQLIQHQFRNCVIPKTIHYFETDGISTRRLEQTIEELIKLLQELDNRLSKSETQAIIYLTWGMPFSLDQYREIETLIKRPYYTKEQKAYLTNALLEKGLVKSALRSPFCRVLEYIKLANNGEYYRFLRRCFSLIKQ
ncbi:MAG: group 1 glycosyl transferase [Neobacillus sp.]|jgi:glycosyltransferase involved in cell wall biosynthesis|nr:group 1 glycosyl transferase [Neobacillus sp.]